MDGSLPGDDDGGEAGEREGCAMKTMNGTVQSCSKFIVLGKLRRVLPLFWA